MHLCTSLFCVKFADDSSFEGSGRSRDEVESMVNDELIKVAKWFKDNRLTLHPDKSRMLVHSRDKLITLKLNNTNIQRCGYGLQEESVKLLGIHIDENLDWGVHIKSVEKKIGKGNYLLWRHRKQLNAASKKILYESFVRCHLNYGLVLWGGAAKNKIVGLEKTVKKIYKKFGPRYMHTNERLSQNKILKFEDEKLLQECKFIWKWNNSKLPNSLRQIVEEKHDRLWGRRFKMTRNLKNGSINIRLAKTATKHIQFISNHRSKESLSQALKQKALDSYQTHCRIRNCFTCMHRVIN